MNRTEELKESDVGTGAGKFEIKKIGDEYFTFVTECKNPKVRLLNITSFQNSVQYFQRSLYSSMFGKVDGKRSRARAVTRWTDAKLKSISCNTQAVIHNRLEACERICHRMNQTI